MAAVVGQQPTVQQSYRQEMRQSHSQRRCMELQTPEGELGDVEADFQSLVNEMVEDGNRRAHSSSSSTQAFKQHSLKSSSSTSKTISSSSTSSSTSFVQKSSTSHKSSASSHTPSPKSNISHTSFKPQPTTDGVVTAMPAMVIPNERDVEGDQSSASEVVVERQMRVRERVKCLERQLSSETLSEGPPEVLLPRGRSGSIKNLAEQFEHHDESSTLPSVNAGAFQKSCNSVNLATSSEEFSKKIEGEFKSVKEVASKFQEPITPMTIRPPPPFNTDTDTVENCEPVAVLPPATMRKPPPSTPPPKPPTPNPIPPPVYTPVPTSEKESAPSAPSIKTSVPWRKESSESIKQETQSVTSKEISEVSAQSSSSVSSESPIQYSAQVKCEVRSRATPEAQEKQFNNNNISSVFSTSSTTDITNSSSRSTSIQSKSKNFISSNTGSSLTSNFSASAPTALAKTAGRPPKVEACDPPPSFSLLRSASTGSVREGVASSMTRATSDKDLPKFNVKKVKASPPFGSRVWSPGQTPDKNGPSRLQSADLPSFKDVPPVWTPARAGSASPSLGRKEYRKITYDGSNMQRKPSQENVSCPAPEESFAWKDRETEKLKSSLPRVQSPTITLLQNKRDGRIESSKPDYLRSEEPPFYKPDDKLYTIKREYESEDEEEKRRFAVLGPRKVEGVGPTTRGGLPVSLKSGVKSEHQGEWYRRMFDSLHKVKDDTLRSNYRAYKGRYGGYMSEPDSYESDANTSLYGTLDRRRNQFDVELAEDFATKNTKRYVHQPGKIENYVPGFSSLSEKELINNPEADVKLEIKSQDPSAAQSSISRFNNSRMQMTHALKDSGYESDSTLVFRKRDTHKRTADPAKIREAYRNIQQGGEVPLTGLQKPAPPKVKETKQSPYKYETGEVNIHYRTPIRIEQKEALSEEELSRRQEEHMKRVYEQERRKKYLSELEDIERRRHTDYYTPLQKATIPLNRYDDESYGRPGHRGPKTFNQTKHLCRALFTFNAQNKRELSFSRGDIITVRRSIDKNWYEGELKGSVGIFPCNYVESIPVESLRNIGRKGREGQARARFNFQAQSPMELSLSKAELVILTRRVDENWYEGRVGNRKGIVPSTYVDTLVEPAHDNEAALGQDPLPRPALPAAHLLYNGTSATSTPASTLGKSSSFSDTKTFNQLSVNTQQDPIPYRALYNYKPQNDDELELHEGDVVLVMEKCDDGWFVGTSKQTGFFGTFPGNYVEKI